MKKIEVTTASYNPRRYSRPWIASVHKAGDRLDFKWGKWISSRHGDEGLLVLETDSPVWAYGQKDGRGNNGHTSYYLTATGKELTKVEAWKVLEGAST